MRSPRRSHVAVTFARARLSHGRRGRILWSKGKIVRKLSSILFKKGLARELLMALMHEIFSDPNSAQPGFIFHARSCAGFTLGCLRARLQTHL